MLNPKELEENRRKLDELAKQSLLTQWAKKSPQPSPQKEGRAVTLKELAAELQMDRSAARRYILRLGVKPQRARTAESGYQTALVFTREQADLIVARRRAEGYC